MNKKWTPNSSLCLHLSFLLSVVLSFLIAIKLRPFYKGAKQSYSDIVVGNIIWTDYFKNGDYIFILSIIVLFIFLFLFLIRILNVILKDKDIYLSYSQSLNTWLQKDNVRFSIFILAYVIMLNIFSNQYSKEYLIGLLFCVIGTSLISRWKIPEQSNFVFQALLTLLVLSFFFSLSILISFYYLNLNNIKILNEVPQITALIMWGIGVYLIIFKKNWFLKYYLVVSKLFQLFIPLLLLIYLNGFYVFENKIIKVVPLKTEVIVFVLILLMILIQFRHIFRVEQDIPNTNSSISIPTLISIAAAVLYNNPIVSTLMYDDFHMGEILLPWQQMFQFNQSYNVDFISVQGLLGVLYSGINNILFDGTIGSFNYSLILIPTIIGVIITILIAKLYGNNWALVYTIIYLPVAASPTLSRLYLVIPIILIIFHPKLLKKPLLWTLVWLWLSALHCFYNTTVGTALTLATVPYVVNFLLSNKHELQNLILSYKRKISIIIFVHFAILIYLSLNIIGTIQFLLDNASTNTQAYGVPFFGETFQIVPDWFPQWFRSYDANRSIWELIRVGGWLGSLFILVFYLAKTSKLDVIDRKEFRLFIVSMVIFLLILIPYGMGRIDPTSMNRSGSVSLFCFTGLLPLFFCLKNGQKLLGFGTVLLLGGTIGIGSIFVQSDYSKYVERVIHPNSVPQGFEYVDGSLINMPNLGKLFIDHNRINELQEINLTINTLLKKDETFADLSNRSLLYLALNKKVPTMYSADYLATNESIQAKIINKLQEENPPVVFIGPSIRHDGGPASLRSYRVYRWFLEKGYLYYEKKGLQFLVRSDRYNELGIGRIENDKNALQLTKVFLQKDMSLIPSAWGRNFDQMATRFAEIKTQTSLVATNQISKDEDSWYRVTGNDPYLTWGFATPLNGLDSDFVLFKIRLKEPIKQGFRFQLYWDSSGIISEENSFYFNGNEGSFLVPLGSAPNWLLNNKLNYFRIDIDGLKVPFTIENIQFLKLIK